MSEFKEYSPEIPHYTIDDIYSDLRNNTDDVLKYADKFESPEDLKEASKRAMKSLETTYFPKLGVLEYCVKNNIYSKPGMQKELMEKVKNLEDLGVQAASDIHEKYGIEVPTFDMTKVIQHYI
jgi:hypothetical protein